MGFRNVRQYVQEQVDNGRSLTSNFRKAPTQTTVGGQFYDMSMAPGYPLPNYYASSPLEASVLDPFRGVFHGDDKPSGSKWVNYIELSGSVAGRGRTMLCDYLLYYPFIDGDSTDEQAMTNDVALPRYADGEGVMAMLVCVAPTTGGGSFTMTYVNQNGDTKVTETVFCNVSAAGIGTIATTESATASTGAVFIPLADGDTGIRSVTSVTMIVPSGGLFSLVLVKAITETVVWTNAGVNEMGSLIHKPFVAEIKNGAYLNFVHCASGTLASTTFVGYINTVWSEE